MDQATDTVSGDHVYADNGVYTVKLRIIDDSGALLAARIDLTVLNADPVLDPLPEVSTNEGGRFNLDADFNDPGTLDTHTATIDWGDGTPTEDATIDETPFGAPGSTEGLDGTVSGTHVYGDNGTYTVTVSIEDDDSGQDSGTFAVTVNNVAPLVDAGPPRVAALPEGQTEVEISLSPNEPEFSDPGFGCSTCDPATEETFNATIDWGDGTVETDQDLNVNITSTPGSPGIPTTGTVTGTHNFGLGLFRGSVSVEDDDQGASSDGLLVIVAQFLLDVAAQAPAQLSEGTPVDFDGTVGLPVEIEDISDVSNVSISWTSVTAQN